MLIKILIKIAPFVDGNQGHFKWVWGPSCFSLCFFYNQLAWLLWRITLNNKGWYQRLSCREIQFIVTSCYGVLQHCLPIHHVLVNMCTTQTSFISWTVWKAGQNLIILSPSPVAVNQNVILSINEQLNNSNNNDDNTFFTSFITVLISDLNCLNIMKTSLIIAVMHTRLRQLWN